jgi:hypothetical protein
VKFGWQTWSLMKLAGWIQGQTTGRTPAIVAVIGHSSSGKTTLAGRLETVIAGAGLLHTDDLAWHQGVFGWGGLLVDDVLPVVRRGEPLHYRPPAWEQRNRPGAIELAGDLPLLLIEGVGASHPSVRSELDLVIWVETDEPTRLARDAPRVDSGEISPASYVSWMAEEDAYVLTDQPWQHADLVVYGGDSVDHDRATEVVVSLPR